VKMDLEFSSHQLLANAVIVVCGWLERVGEPSSAKLFNET